MTKYTTVFGDLLRWFSRSEFEKAVVTRKADLKVRKFTCFDLFKAMLYGLITSCFGVREIEASMKANRSRLYHAGIKEPVKRSTFCDALEKRPQEAFEDVFHAMVAKAQGIAGRIKRKFRDPLRIIDATVITLCLERFDWAKYRKAKGAVKLHLNLDGDSLMPFDAQITNGKAHDSQQMQNLCTESWVIYVMDRGYVDFKSLWEIDLQESIFVTRIKSNIVYKRIHNNPHAEDGPVISDVAIELTGNITKKRYPKPLRKVKYQDPETRKAYEFMTNDMMREATEIAAIYKERWEVELFFKWLKQHVKIKSFWGTSLNAVYSQIWVALILTILLWIHKALNGLDESAYKLLVMAKAALLSKNTLVGLCTNTAPPDPTDDSLQLTLQGFKF